MPRSSRIPASGRNRLRGVVGVVETSVPTIIEVRSLKLGSIVGRIDKTAAIIAGTILPRIERAGRWPRPTNCGTSIPDPVWIGPPSRTRTCGLRLRAPALSLPLSYGWKKCYRRRLDREATHELVPGSTLCGAHHLLARERR